MDLQRGLVVDAHAGCDAAVIVAGDCAAAAVDELDADWSADDVAEHSFPRRRFLKGN